MATDRLRTAEVVGSLCLATDLGVGLPFGHGLNSTVVAVRLARRLGVDPETAVQVYYGCLLFYAGCTADAWAQADLFPDVVESMEDHWGAAMFADRREARATVIRLVGAGPGGSVRRGLRAASKLARAQRGYGEHTAALCDVAEMLAQAVALPPPVSRQFHLLTERWDGEGPLGRAAGADLPLSIRIVHVARDVTFQQLLRDPDAAVDVIRSRAGGAFDPAVVDALSADLLGETAGWPEALDAEPEPHRTIGGDQIDDALLGLAAFADLADVVGHSAAVADLAADAAEIQGWEPDLVAFVRRAALVHDLGKVGVPFRIWQRDGTSSADDREKARLHPYYTERTLAASPMLAELAAVAECHHERLDGSGYHRGETASRLTAPARLIAAADAYRCEVEARPGHSAMTAQDSAEVLRDEARRGTLDPDAVAAVLAAAGHRPQRIERPSGLTRREEQTLALVAEGLATKQIGHHLGVTAKTADHYVQQVYEKIGVSTRAAAAVYAMRHGLAPQREELRPG